MRRALRLKFADIGGDLRKVSFGLETSVVRRIFSSTHCFAFESFCSCKTWIRTFDSIDCLFPYQEVTTTTPKQQCLALDADKSENATSHQRTQPLPLPQLQANVAKGMTLFQFQQTHNKPHKYLSTRDNNTLNLTPNKIQMAQQAVKEISEYYPIESKYSNYRNNMVFIHPNYLVFNTAEWYEENTHRAPSHNPSVSRKGKLTLFFRFIFCVHFFVYFSRKKKNKKTT